MLLCRGADSAMGPRLTEAAKDVVLTSSWEVVAETEDGLMIEKKAATGKGKTACQSSIVD